MRAGLLRHRVDFQQLGLVQDPGTGEMLPGWLTIWPKVPASFEPLSARDMIAAQAVQSEATARVVIRYRAGVLPTMRIIHRGEVYDIKGPALADPDSGRDYLTIVVAKGVNDG
jgi:SPP1 family predicted phage head-tail adaptor